MAEPRTLDLSSFGDRASMGFARGRAALGEGDTTMAKNGIARAARKELADVPRQLAALASMSVPDLAEKYLEVYGEPTRSRNRDYLKKRLSFRIQELAEGSLSTRAVTRIAELGDKLPERWRMRQVEETKPSAPPPAAADVRAAAADARAPAADGRDARLPPPGTVLTRAFKGTQHRVTVREGGVEYEGQLHRSLSSVAKLITGTAWNGFSFFGLKAGGPKAVKS
ncbi:putative bacteriophage-related protein [Stigmatella aurantiaca DW4/3-1]|nr:putative bacteriophage-related protein [Stigmatella aurantiaca DW4/3-1]